MKKRASKKEKGGSNKPSLVTAYNNNTTPPPPNGPFSYRQTRPASRVSSNTSCPAGETVLWAWGKVKIGFAKCAVKHAKTPQCTRQELQTHKLGGKQQQLIVFTGYVNVLDLFAGAWDRLCRFLEFGFRWWLCSGTKRHSMGGFTAKNHNWRSFFRRCIPEIHAVLVGLICGHPRASLWPLNR